MATANWRKIDAEKALVIFACGNCGAAETWGGGAVDVADDVPYCVDCEHPMAFSGVCVAE